MAYKSSRIQGITGKDQFRIEDLHLRISLFLSQNRSSPFVFLLRIDEIHSDGKKYQVLCIGRARLLNARRTRVE